MKSVRLTQDMRQKILCRLLEHAFGDRQKELRTDDEAFGLAVYEDVYDVLTRRRMKAFPEGFLKLKIHLKVAFGGQQDQVCWKGLRPTSAAHEYDRAKSYLADHPLSKRRDELEQRRSRLREEQNKSRSQIKSVLDSCSTIRQLVEIWPEASSFVEDFAASGPAAVTALALPIKSLNEQLGLPPVQVVPEVLGTVGGKLARKLQLSSTYGKFGKTEGAGAQ